MTSQPIRLATVGLIAIAALAAGWVGVTMVAAGNQDNAPTGDNQVSHSEMEAAIDNTLACFEDAGVEPNPIEGEGQRHTKLGFSVPPKDGDPEKGPDPEAMAAVQECKEAHYMDEARAYASQQTKPSDAQLETAAAMLEACVAEGGRPDVDINGFGYGGYAERQGIQPEISEDEFEAYAQCAVALETEQGLYTPKPKIVD